MIDRKLSQSLADALAFNPAVALIGPRQVGKTTLALEVARHSDALYLDLESDEDRAKLAQPELYLADHLDKLIILDEVHRTPGLFPVLRGLIDRARRAGRRSGWRGCARRRARGRPDAGVRPGAPRWPASPRAAGARPRRGGGCESRRAPVGFRAPPLSKRGSL